MHIFESVIEEDGSGIMELACKTQDDLWHLYNVIRVGDHVEAITDRKVIFSYSNDANSDEDEDEGSEGSKKGGQRQRRKKPIRISMILHIKVISVDFDPVWNGIRVNGRVVEGNEYVEEKAYHTLDINLHTKFLLMKKYWSSVDIQRIENAEESNMEAMAAVILHEGLAQICLITENMTVVKAKIEMQVARKRAGFNSKHEKSLQVFMETVAKTFLRHINVDNMKAVIVAGRGFLHDKFLATLFDVADKTDEPLKKKHKGKFVCVNVASGFKHSLQEIMLDPATSKLLADTKAQEEMQAYNQFMDLFNNDASRAFYGYKHVSMANEHNAIDTLMISDALFRSNNVEQRKQCIALVESVQEKNGKVLIFSSMHASGEQLNQITGIAAILRFPLPELEDEDMDDEDDYDDSPVKVVDYKCEEIEVDFDVY